MAAVGLLWCFNLDYFAIAEVLVVEACDSVRLVVVTLQQIVLRAIVIIALAPITKAMVALIPQPFLELAHNSFCFGLFYVVLRRQTLRNSYFVADTVFLRGAFFLAD